MTPTQLSNQELIEKCEDFISHPIDITALQDKKELVSDLLSRFRTLSGQGKDVEALISSIIINKPNLEEIARSGKISGTLYTELKRILNTAQPAPVSVEDVVNNLVSELHNKLYKYITTDELRTAINEVLNPKP